MKKIISAIFAGLLAFLLIACVGKEYSLSIEDADKNITLTEGASTTVIPTYTAGATLVWESSNDEVVTVLEGTITAVAEGSAVVTITLKENSKLKVEITVTVNKEEIIKEFTVTFKEDNTSVKVKEGEKATKPADPVKEGFVFKGWFTDEACTKEYDFEQVVTADLDLYAKWEEAIKEFTVTFKEDNSSVKVLEGEKVSKPADPTKEGYEFKGWYTDEACTVAYDFEQAVTADLDLYAKWEKLPVVATVAEILASEETLFEVSGYVAAINARSFILKDSTGAMLVYRGSKWTADVAVGDAVKVTGSVSAYGGAKQFGDSAVVVKDGTAVVDHGDVKELDGAAVDAYASLESIKAEYVKVEGILSVSGNYINLAIEGATLVGSLTYPADADAIKAFADKKVAVTGYVTGVTGSNTKYLNILFIDVEEVIENVNVSINWGITSAEIGLEFYNDFNKYAGVEVPFDSFMKDSASAIKVALANEEMLAKWNWLWVYMKADLESMTSPANPDFVNDTIKLLGQLIEGDTTAITNTLAPGPNGRTMIRSYMHGVMHNSKGSTDNAAFAENTPSFESKEAQDALVDALYASKFEVLKGEKFEKPATPDRKGYELIGWFADEACTTPFDFDAALEADVTIYVKWEVVYNVSFVYGITSEMIGIEFYNDFVKYAGTDIPFDTFHSNSHPAVKTALANAEMLAKWQWLFEYMKADLEKMENLTYPEFVSDTILLLEQLIAGDTTAIANAAAPGPNGRTLIRSYMHGVMHNMKGCGAANEKFAEVSPDFSDPALQAALVEALYASKVKLSDNQKLTKPADPTRPEYDFLGWYTDEVCTVEYDFDQIVTKDLTLYARWELSKCNVTFTGIDSTVEVTRGETVAKPVDPEKEGYFFRGWYVDEELTTPYDFDAPVLSHLVLYPKFEEQLSEYNITLAHGLTSADIGMLFYIDFVKYAGTDVPFDTFHANSHPAIKTALANAEMLSKWATLWEYMIADFTALNEAEENDFYTETIAVLERFLQGDTTAIEASANARTLIRSYVHGVMHNMKGCGSANATFAALCPDFSDEAIQKAFFEAFYKSEYQVAVFEKFVKSADPVKYEYEFKGWFTDEACTKEFDFDTQIIDNYTLYALWKPTFEMYKVTFDSIDLTVEVKENKTVAKPDVPEKVGYSFVGWYSDELFTTEFDFNTPITADTVIYGKWIGVETFTVTFDLDGGVFEDGYKTSAEIGKAFYDDFVKYAGETIPFETFHASSHPAVMTALSNTEMLEKWNWLWVYMLEDLKAYNGSNGGSYTADTYTVLEKLAQGDTDIIRVSAAPGPNGRTLIRAYMHGVMHNMKGCGAANTTFAAYCPDYSNADVQKALVLVQFGTQMKVTAGNLIPTPTKEGYKFDGWYTEDGTKVTAVTENVTVKAKWVETVLVSDVTITNKVAELELLKTLQLTWTIAPEEAINKLVKFESSNPEVATIDSNGLITAVGKGTTTIKVISLSASGKSDEFVLEVTVPAYFDISYETESYVEIGNEVLLNCEYIDGKNKGTIVWSSLNPEIAVVDAQGKVTGVDAGVATIRASVEGKDGVYQDLYVTVVPENLSDAMKLVLASHNSNAFVKYELGIGAGVPNYYTDVIGSVSKLLFEEFKVNTDYNQASNEKYGDELESRKMDSIEFIVVHYTAGFNTTAGAKAHIEYFAQPLSQNATSIHYTTGNDGIYKGLDEGYKAAHAGDSGSGSEFAWRDTEVVVLDTDPVIPVVTITSNATFAINGRDTGIKVPEETKFNRGFVTDSKWLNAQGIAVNKKDGKYQLGTAWWCYTQIAEGRICSNGGNGNGIGIETAVNYGSDLWYTWQKTAMLVADIMIRNNLDISKVKGHHFFSGKDCPQPLLENDLEIWNEFIEMVQSEYEKMSKYSNCEFDFVCSNSNVNEVGRVIKQELTSQVVQYTITVFNNDTDTQETITLSTIVEGIYAK